MDEVSDDPFSGSRLALQQHGSVGRCEPFDGLVNTQDGFALALEILCRHAFLGQSGEKQFATRATLFQRLGNQN